MGRLKSDNIDTIIYVLCKFITPEVVALRYLNTSYQFRVIYASKMAPCVKTYLVLKVRWNVLAHVLQFQDENECMYIFQYILL